MFNFLKKNNLVAPVNGKIIPIEEVPDPVFAQKMMGEGIAIIPEDSSFVAPADGTYPNFRNKTCLWYDSR